MQPFPGGRSPRPLYLPGTVLSWEGIVGGVPTLARINPHFRCYLALSLVFLTACAPAEDWRGTVEEIDGVTYVSNPAEPLWGTSAEGEPRLSLELEQVFGVDREPAEAILGAEYQLSVDVDADGNVYVLDGQASQLVAFDSRGAVRWRAGRKGKGPGELYEPREVAVGPAGTVVVGNNSGRQLSLWDGDGNYLSIVSLTEPPLALTHLRAPGLAGFLAPERLVLTSGMPGKIGTGIVVIDPFAPATIEEFAWDQQPDIEMPWNVSSGPSVTAGHDGTIMMGSAAGYRFRVYDADGNALREVRRAVDYPVRSGFWDEDGGVGVAGFGEVLAPMPLGPDYLLVCVVWDLNIDDPDATALTAARAIRERRPRPHIGSRVSFDLFDRGGRLLYSLVERPDGSREEGRWRKTGRPQFIGPDNRLYTIADEPFSQIRRYRVEIH